MQQKKLSIILAFYIIAFSSLFTLLTSMVQLYKDYKTELAQLHENMEMIQQSYTNSLSNSLWEVNDQQVNLLIDGMFQLPYVTHIKIDTPFQKRYDKGTSQPTRKILKRSYRLEYATELDENNHPYYVGQLEIDYDLDLIYEQILQKGKLILQTQAIQTFAIALFILFITYYLITRHLGRISKFAEQLSIEQLDRPLKLNRTPWLKNRLDEIDILVHALENMRLTLKKDLQQQLLLQAAIQQSSNAIFITNKQGIIEFVNQSFERITGYTAHEAIGQNMHLIRAPQTTNEEVSRIISTITDGQTWKGEILNKHKQGHAYWVRATISPVKRHQQITHFVSVSEDISAQKETQSQIEKLSSFNSITNLENRSLFQHRLQQLCQQQVPLWLILIDLQQFKQINDRFGHHTGDTILKMIAKRLTTQCQQLVKAHLFHIGIDEFMIILESTWEVEKVTLVVRQLINQVNQPLKLHPNAVKIQCNVALTHYPTDANSSEILLRNIDLAMIKSKEQPNIHYQFYQKQLDQLYLNKIAAENELKQAIQNNEFVLYYQPKIQLHDHSLEGFEALIRWIHPTKGLIPPFDFIPLAEESGLIVELGEFVIRQACIDIKKLNQHYSDKADFRVAINLSAKQFHDPSLFESVRHIIEETQCKSEWLELELTESMLMTNINEALVTLNAFKELGLKLSIDDFGTGYSSLNYLKTLPIDTLKIDRSFVKDIHNSANDRAICSAVIAMAHSLNLKVVAEGIEENTHHQFLKDKLCDLGQGYFYAKPLPFPDLMAFIERQ